MDTKLDFSSSPAPAGWVSRVRAVGETHMILVAATLMVAICAVYSLTPQA